MAKSWRERWKGWSTQDSSSACKYCGQTIDWIWREGRWLPRNRDATNHVCPEYFSGQRGWVKAGPLANRPATPTDTADLKGVSPVPRYQHYPSQPHR